ncbi:MAG: methyltransferase domain-containing protein, partial [Thermoplasmata archaeon]
GLDRLVRGGGLALPFRTDSFDATILVHVLHVLPEPTLVVRRAGRVSRRAVFAVLSERLADAAGPGTDPRRLVREALRQAGVRRPPRADPSVRERLVLDRIPPDSVRPLSDRSVEEPVERYLDRIASRSFGGSPELPEAALHQALDAVREATAGSPPLRHRRRYALARWDAERLKLAEP